MNSSRSFFYGYLLLILTCGLNSSRTFAAGVELEWCLDHFPPRQSYLPGQLPSGPMVDMMQKLAKQSGFVLKFSTPTPAARCLLQMQQGKTDLMTDLLWSEQREQYMLLLPFDEARGETLFVRKDKPIADQSALKSTQIVLIKGRSYTKHFMEMLQQQEVTVRTADDLQQAMAMLHFKQVDAVAGPKQISENLLKDNPRLKASIMLNPWQTEISRELQSHLALSRLSPHFDLHLRISQQLQKLVAANETHFYH
ncbi:MAG: transporter substrate-binding domain-containing protein [Gammaproteobacteria bacterium]|nr:transporter substrate-binding domain-containing protein [Gammaproteobacteria bacterium]MBU2427105.1 transporter substrate-binding domain-containing protein [Gammaproteobacteria bacterium]